MIAGTPPYVVDPSWIAEPLRDEYARVACPSGSLSFRRGGAGLTRLLGAGLTLHGHARAGGPSLRPPASTSVYRLRPTGGDVLHEVLQVQRGVEVPVDHQAARLAMEHPALTKTAWFSLSCSKSRSWSWGTTGRQ